jgi:aspartate racemase
VKKIGIIGGAGPLASALLYTRIVELCYEHGIGHDEIEIVIINYPFTLAMLEKPDQIRRVLESCIFDLKSIGCVIIAIACNSLHRFVPEYVPDAEIILIQKPVLARIDERLHKHVLLLSTATTVKSRMYVHEKARIITLSKTEQSVVTAIIKRVLAGKVLARDRDALSSMIRSKHQEEPLDGVILGCTELPVLHKAHALKLPDEKVELLDTIDLLAQTLVKAARS